MRLVHPPVSSFVAVSLLSLWTQQDHSPVIWTSAMSTTQPPNTSMSNHPNGIISPLGSSLGASPLRQLVTKAAQKDVEESDSGLDLTGIVWLEHVNIVAGGPKSLIEHFYLDVLGCTKDASKSFHVNMGQQQFHLAVAKAEEDETPQYFDGGSIGIAVPNLDSLRSRIHTALESNIFDGTSFELMEDQTSSSHHHQHLTLRGPWGNIFHCYSIQHEDDATSLNSQPPSSHQKMVNAHASGTGMYGSHRMAVRNQPGIRYVEIPCPAGKASAIATFYRDMMKCTVHTLSQPTSDDDNDNHNNCVNDNDQQKLAVTTVSVGPGVHLVFKETNEYSKLQSASQGIHICVYTHDFNGLYQRLKERNLIWTNPRFTHLDSCDTWEEASNSRTLRFKHLTDLDDDDFLLELEHETRPLRHGQYLKVPKYDPK